MRRDIKTSTFKCQIGPNIINFKPERDVLYSSQENDRRNVNLRCFVVMFEGQRTSQFCSIFVLNLNQGDLIFFLEDLSSN